MARKRMIDPSIWISEDFGSLSPIARILFIGMFSMADDEGRGNANENYLKSVVFAYDDIAKCDIECAIKEIATHMSVVFYKVANKSHYQLLHWDMYQTINKPTPSKIPPLSEKTEILYKESTPTEQLHENYGSDNVTLPPNRKEKNRKEKNRKEYMRKCFARFWEIYPKKKDKKKAEIAFMKLDLTEELFETIESALIAQKKSEQWTKDGGAFIPLPTTWLNGARWEDEQKVSVGTKASLSDIAERDYSEEELKSLIDDPLKDYMGGAAT